MLLLEVILGTLVGLVAAEFDPELHAKYLTLPESSFIEYFNAQGYSWKMSEYENTWAPIAPYVNNFEKESINELSLETHDLEGTELPDNFDARQQWPQCETIKEVRDQGTCSYSWAIAAATTASDRTCIHKDIHVRLAEQDFDCFAWGGSLCDLENLNINMEEVFEYWKQKGLVTQECKPYNILHLILDECESSCVNGAFYTNDKHYADSFYELPNDNDKIKAELVKNGPVTATFHIFEDFLKYKSGIYEHSHGVALGFHRVRVIGYGVENGTDYWLAANSWGGSWGEHGFFRIKTNQQGVDFEDDLHTGLPLN